MGALVVCELVRTNVDCRSTDCSLTGERHLGSFSGVLFSALFCATVQGCAPSGDSVKDTDAVVAAPIAHTLEVVKLGEAGAPMIFRAGGADCRTDAIVVADISEGVVQLRDHGVWSTIGHKGFGPGELQLPMHPRFFGADAVAVLDVSDGQLEVYGLDGTFRRSIPLRARLEVIWDYEVFDDSLIAAVGTRGDGSIQEFVVLSPADSLLARQTFVLPRRPAGTPDSPLWRTQARVSLAVSDGRAILTTPLIDSVYFVPLRRSAGDGELSALQIPVPEYKAPTLPDTLPKNSAAVMSWWRSVPLVADVFATRGQILVPIARGTYWETDSSEVFGLDSLATAWLVDTRIAPILGVGDGCGVSIRGQASPEVSIVLWESSSP